MALFEGGKRLFQTVAGTDLGARPFGREDCDMWLDHLSESIIIYLSLFLS